MTDPNMTLAQLKMMEDLNEALSHAVSVPGTNVTIRAPDFKSDDDDEEQTWRVFMGYRCQWCDCIYSSSDYEPSSARYHGRDGLIPLADGDSCGYVYTVNTGTDERVWHCGGGCFHHDEEKQDEEMYECTECGDYYDNLQEAKECC